MAKGEDIKADASVTLEVHDEDWTNVHVRLGVMVDKDNVWAVLTPEESIRIGLPRLQFQPALLADAKINRKRVLIAPASGCIASPVVVDEKSLPGDQQVAAKFSLGRVGRLKKIAVHYSA